MSENSRLRQASKITEKFLNNDAFGLFRYPVDLMELPDYNQIIKKPSDLTTVSNRLKRGEYKKYDEWYEDMSRIFKNALKYNSQDPLIVGYTTECQKIFNKECKEIDPPVRELKDHMKRQLSKMTKLMAQLTQKMPDVFPKDDRYTSDQLVPLNESDTKKLIDKVNNMTNPEDVLKVTQIMEYFGIEKMPSNKEEARYHSDNLTDAAKIFLRAEFFK